MNATFGKTDLMARNCICCDCCPLIRWVKIWLGVLQTESNFFSRGSNVKICLLGGYNYNIKSPRDFLRKNHKRILLNNLILRSTS